MSKTFYLELRSADGDTAIALMSMNDFVEMHKNSVDVVKKGSSFATFETSLGSQISVGILEID